MPVEVSSYLIRLWRETGTVPEPAPEWRSEVEHLQSGQRWSFQTVPALLAFMTAQTQCPPDNIEPPRQSRRRYEGWTDDL
jgi:hypothetical protein